MDGTTFVGTQPFRVLEETEMAETYKTVQGDTWDMIAKKVYGDEKRLDYLMAHNFLLLNYFVFPAGVIVQTPDMKEDTISELPEWRK